MSTEEINARWVPEICYEDDDDGLTSKIPFIEVPKNERMPSILFIFEARETGEFEPGPSGEAMPIVDLDLHQFADMNALKEGLTRGMYDCVRIALGLEPLSEAVPKGLEITERVRNNVALKSDGCVK